MLVGKNILFNLIWKICDWYTETEELKWKQKVGQDAPISPTLLSIKYLNRGVQMNQWSKAPFTYIQDKVKDELSSHK